MTLLTRAGKEAEGVNRTPTNVFISFFFLSFLFTVTRKCILIVLIDISFFVCAVCCGVLKIVTICLLDQEHFL